MKRGLYFLFDLYFLDIPIRCLRAHGLKLASHKSSKNRSLALGFEKLDVRKLLVHDPIVERRSNFVW